MLRIACIDSNANLIKKNKTGTIVPIKNVNIFFICSNGKKGS